MKKRGLLAKNYTNAIQTKTRRIPLIFLKFRYLDYCIFIRKYQMLIRKEFEF
jgi:hypothetical protein